jgi:adenosylcobinamide-phosphate guanylyltransferase
MEVDATETVGTSPADQRFPLVDEGLVRKFRQMALVTAGGKGTRMKDAPGEKPLLPVSGRPMVDRVLDALRACHNISGIYASVSDNAPITRDHLIARGVQVVETSGTGYVADLNQAMKALSAESVLVCPADMPLLTKEAVEDVIAHYVRSRVASMSVAVPVGIVRSLGTAPSFTTDVDGREVVLCGVSIVDRKRMLTEETLSQGFMLTDDERFALNINTRGELEKAERWLAARRLL